MIIVVQIMDMDTGDLIVMHVLWWLCQDTVHLHEEDIMVEGTEEGMVEVEDGKFKNPNI